MNPEGAMATIRLYPNSHVKPESAYLRKFRKNITSQCGEDGLIEKILEIIGMTNKWCVEFGAWDGKEFSNSWALINNHGWNSVLIEANQKKFRELEGYYAGNDKAITVNALVDVNAGNNSLDAILAHTPIPADFDFLCIDIDGCDWHIWDSLANYHPRLVLIEFNPSIPNHVSFVQDKDMNVNQGSSLRAMIELGKKKGYELVATTEWNAFFVKASDYSAFGIDDNSIDSMHSIDAAESAFFQLFDGTVALCGCTKLLWCGVPIAQEDIQVLPRALRRYRG
jgi:hypothetical protein